MNIIGGQVIINAKVTGIRKHGDESVNIVDGYSWSTSEDYNYVKIVPNTTTVTINITWGDMQFDYRLGIWCSGKCYSNCYAAISHISHTIVLNIMI